MKVLSIDEYFDDMELTDEQKEKRKEMAEELKTVFLLFLMSLRISFEYDVDVSVFDETSKLTDRYMSVISKFIIVTPLITSYVQSVVLDIVETTIKDREKQNTLSEDRALYLAENEANSVANYEEFELAKEQGYTRKRWVSMRDLKVRHTHIEVDGDVENIDNAFVVGDSLMMFPKDASLNASASEIINCRCSIEYLK